MFSSKIYQFFSTFFGFLTVYTVTEYLLQSIARDLVKQYKSIIRIRRVGTLHILTEIFFPRPFISTHVVSQRMPIVVNSPTAVRVSHRKFSLYVHGM